MATKAKGALRWQLFSRAWLMAALLMAPYFLKKLFLIDVCKLPCFRLCVVDFPGHLVESDTNFASVKNHV